MMRRRHLLEVLQGGHGVQLVEVEVVGLHQLQRALQLLLGPRRVALAGLARHEDLRAGKVSGRPRPKRCKLAHAFLWE